MAGLFYPADRAELKAAVERNLSEASESQDSSVLRALVCPHAGYVYSGPIAAVAYKLLRKHVANGRGFRRVVVLSPAHRVGFRGIALPKVRAFATPLGEVPLSPALEALSKEVPFIVDDRPHAEEHAIEVQLPFLQCVLGGFELLPLLFGAELPGDPTTVLDGLLDDHTLFVVSTDLSHYLEYEDARRLDERTLTHFLSLSADDVARDDACGRSPAAALLRIAKKRFWTVRRLDYRNSGDTAGDKRRVVGYAALSLTDSD
ncbi:MAG: AmmeMemoRadiSam system protein B [Polyangiaceae bacterium]